MKIDHIAIWTSNLERLREFYMKYFNGTSNEKYINRKKNFESYFISFDSGARLELMQMPGIPENNNDTITQYKGIIHICFEAESMQKVNDKAVELSEAGFPVLKGPRKTGDGYWEFETLDPDKNRIEVCALFKQ